MQLQMTGPELEGVDEPDQRDRKCGRHPAEIGAHA